MAVRTHYDVLGVRPDASPTTIRDAYRRLAREHHPDRARHGSAVGGASMPEINEAYRVLADPGRRAVYDATLRGTTGRTTATSTSASASGGASARTAPVDDHAVRFTHDLGPARVPWRMLLLAGTIAIVGIVVLAQFTEPGEDPGPDNILRVGDCVEFEDNGDAREVRCTGDDADNVVRAFIPFDATCPGGTELHRDRQGMGNVCVDVPR